MQTITEQSKIQRHVEPGLHVIALTRGPIEELFITATPHNGDSFLRMFADVNRVVKEAGATIITTDVFGIPPLEQEGMKALRDVWGKTDWPITWLAEGATAGISLTGVQVHAIRGADVKRIRVGDRVVGSVFQDAYARHCHLGDLWPANLTNPRGVQAREIYELMEATVRKAGMTFDNICRTWLYLDHILDWYGELNQVRNKFYKEHGTFDKLVPASTGIGGANSARSAMIADAYAIELLDPKAKVFAVPSPLQCPALEYGSSFARAVEVDLPDHRTVWVSGTASIEPGGKTVYLDDIKGQVQLTMDVVEAILTSRKMTWHDVTRGVAYVKHASYAAEFRDYCARNELNMPFVTTENDVCRDDLLFEIEVDAVTV